MMRAILATASGMEMLVSKVEENTERTRFGENHRLSIGRAELEIPVIYLRGRGEIRGRSLGKVRARSQSGAVGTSLPSE